MTGGVKTPVTPIRLVLQRLLASAALSSEEEAQLFHVFERINPAEVQRKIALILHQLWRLGAEGNNMRQKLR